MLHCLPIPGSEGSLTWMITKRTDKRSSHAVETFFLTGDPMNIIIQTIPGKNTQNLVAPLSLKTGSPWILFWSLTPEYFLLFLLKLLH